MTENRITLSNYFPVVRAPQGLDRLPELDSDTLAAKQWTLAMPHFIKRVFEDSIEDYPNINKALFNLVYRVLVGGSKVVAQTLAKKLQATPKCRQVISKSMLSDLFRGIDKVSGENRDYSNVSSYADPEQCDDRENVVYSAFTVGIVRYPFEFMVVCAVSSWLHAGATLIGYHTQNEIPSTYPQVEQEDVKFRRGVLKSWTSEARNGVDCILQLHDDLPINWGPEGPPDDWNPDHKRFKMNERIVASAEFLSRHAFTWLDGRGGDYKAKAGETSQGIRANAAQIKSTATSLAETQDDVKSLQMAVETLREELRCLKLRFEGSQPELPARPPTEFSVARGRKVGGKSFRDDEEQ